ncbi:MAG: hypothetical protein WCS77_08375 [Elusimicrobiaceae bacterium]
MTQPNPIQNGDIPDANKLMAWFNWLSAGRGIKTGTYDELKNIAALNPADPFDCFATDTRQRLFYTGDTNDGDGGFIILG